MAGMLRSGNIACGLTVAISMGIGGQYRHADPLFDLSFRRMTSMNAYSPLGCIAFAMSCASAVFATESPCARCAAPTAPRVVQVCFEDEEQPSWVFRRSTYTHDPNTG